MTATTARTAPAPGATSAEPAVAPTYLVRTLGCQMNVHDSEHMAGMLEQAATSRHRPTRPRRGWPTSS